MNLNNFFREITLKRKIVLKAGVFLSTFCFIVYFIVFPSVAEIKKIKKEIEAQRIYLENKYLKSKSLKRLATNIKKIEEELQNLDQVFINQNRALEFITTLEGIAKKNNIFQKINLENSTNEKIEKQYQRIPLKISLEGNFTDEMRYLSELESLNYYINIKNLEISNLSDKENRGNTSMLITAETFWE